MRRNEHASAFCSRICRCRDLCRAAGAGARIIGVNNRDLRDFHVTLETSLDLIEESDA